MSLLLITLFGCSNEPQSKADELGPLLIELGTGEWDWEALEDDGDIPVIEGPQGGFHFLGSVRVSGIEAGSADDLSDPLNPTTTFSVWRDGENLAPASRFVQGLDPAPTDARPYRHQMVGRFVIMNIENDDELDGVELDLTVAVHDANGTTTEASLHLTAYPHPLNH
jgi:hypothetical protein